MCGVDEIPRNWPAWRMRFLTFDEILLLSLRIFVGRL